MGTRPVAALLGLMSLCCCALSYAGPVLTLPPATTAPPMKANAPTTAPVAGSAATPVGTAAGAQVAKAGAPLPPPRFGARQYSYLDVVGFQEQPYGNEDIGHGQRLLASYALSDNAFLLADWSRHNGAEQVVRRYDVGVGIDTDQATGHSVFLALLWNGVGVQPQSGGGHSAHGYGVELGVRAMALPKMELFALGRYDNNNALAGHSAGETGFFYEFTPAFALGFDLGVDALENDYLVTLRWYY